MNILSTCSLVPIRTPDCRTYSGMAFDNCFFYLTSPQGCFINKFDTCFEMLESIETCRSYDCICYDQTDQCFWASCAAEFNKIFKLDCHFREIACLYIDDAPIECTKIVSISYDCMRNTLFIAYVDSIIEISKNGSCIRLIETPYKTRNRSILIMPPYYVTVSTERYQQFIGIYDGNGQLIKRCRFPRKYAIKSILLYSCREDQELNYYFYMLASKHRRYPYIIKCKFAPCSMNIILYDCQTGCFQLCEDNCCDEQSSFEPDSNDL